MEDQNNLQPETGKQSRPWMLLVYFVGLFVFGQLVAFVFAQLQGSATIQGFAKLNQIIAESLDVTRNRDDVITTIWSLVLTFLLVIPVGWVYTYTKSRDGYDRSLVQTLIVMGMVVCGMMMLIQDQFSRALALVGVVSAVRFRTNLRDPKDAVYVLISIGIGMGAGLQVPSVAAWLTVVMCAVFLLLHRFRIGESPAGEASFVDLSSKKDKDKKKKKKKDKDKVGLPGLATPSRLERIAESLKDKEHGVRKPNTVVLIEAVDSEAAIGFLSQTLGALEIPWHLVTVSPGDGVTTLEYLIRLDDGESPDAFAAQVEAACGNSVRSVDVRTIEAVAV